MINIDESLDVWGDDGDDFVPSAPEPTPDWTPKKISELPNVCPSRLQPHSFSEVIFDTVRVHFQIVRFDGCVWIWFGDVPQFGNLSLTMQTPYDKTPSSTCLLGDAVDNWGQNFAQKLGRKLAEPLYVSCNMSDPEPMLQSAVEKRILQELRRLSILA